jgi:hypothetical protein
MKGSGGILLIGVAVFMIAASLTGKLDAIWDALRGVTGGDAEAAPDDTGNNGGTTNQPKPGKGCQQGDYTMTSANDSANPGKVFCCPQDTVGSLRSDGSCPAMYSKGYYEKDGESIIACFLISNCQAQNVGTGEASYNLSLLPTGFTTTRYAPNV